MNCKTLLTTILGLFFASPLFGGEIWVSPAGNDKNTGTADRPLQTVSAALRKAREWRRLNDPATEGGIDIILKDGTYYQSEPLFIRPEDSGKEGSLTVIRAENDTYPVISGGVPVKGWRKLTERVPGMPRSVRGKIWVADVPVVGNRPCEFRQLWVDHSKAVRARQSEPEAMERILSFDPEKEEITIPTPSTPLPADPGQMEMMIHQRWAVAFLRVKSIETHGAVSVVKFHNPESRIEFEHPWPQPIADGERNSPFILSNAVEFLDSPGEWYLDNKQGKIYYYPRPGEDMATTEVVAPLLETVIEFSGTLARPVTHVAFEGVQFSHTSWMRPSHHGHVPLQTGFYIIDAYKLRVPGLPDKESLENQAWIGRPASGVTLTASDNIQFINCKFKHMASTGLDLVTGCHDIRIEGCLFKDIGGTGLMAGEFPDRGYETHVPWRPDNPADVCARIDIVGNLITDVTNEDWGGVGIGVGYASDIRIEHNEVTDVNYSGISVGWGWFSKPNSAFNNIIRANRVHNFAKQMYDVGGIYTLSAQPGSVIEYNAVYDISAAPYAANDRAFYIYFDEGSAFIDVRNNWTPEEKYDCNTPGSGNHWYNNGPMAPIEVKEQAGLIAPYHYLYEDK